MFENTRNSNITRCEQFIAEYTCNLPNKLADALARYNAEVAAITAKNEAEIRRHETLLAFAKRIDVERALPVLAHIWKRNTGEPHNDSIAYMNELYRMLVYGITFSPEVSDTDKKMLSEWVYEEYSHTGRTLSEAYHQQNGLRTIAWPIAPTAHLSQHIDIQHLLGEWHVNAGKIKHDPAYSCTLIVGSKFVEFGCGNPHCYRVHELPIDTKSHYVISVPAASRPTGNQVAPAWFSRLPSCNPAIMPFHTPPMKTESDRRWINGVRALLSDGETKIVHTYRDPVFSMQSPVLILPASSDATVVSFRMKNNLSFVDYNVDVTITADQIRMFRIMFPERDLLQQYETIAENRVIPIPAGPFNRVNAHDTEVIITFDKPVGDVEMINRGYADIMCEHDRHKPVHVWRKGTEEIYHYSSWADWDKNGATHRAGGTSNLVILFGSFINT